MLTSWQWAAIAAVPPALVALYFLKLRRQPLQVPSTYLWRKSIEDLHVNSLLQKLRQSLLLWLQLLLLALLILALLRPNWTGRQLSGGRYIFLVDNSASMGATDVAPNRLAEAKRRVELLIDEMNSGDVAMIVSFADGAQVAQAFTSNRQDLRRALAAIPQTDHATSLEEALRVAGGLANSGANA
ncbi:MAG TPA: BatA and WFA domain-containing protein, partial [Pirellulales bacterium]|nr:BatA and WFA domain-containing protein [Pirellulales bacterium]